MLKITIGIEMIFASDPQVVRSTGIVRNLGAVWLVDLPSGRVVGDTAYAPEDHGHRRNLEQGGFTEESLNGPAFMNKSGGSSLNRRSKAGCFASLRRTRT